MAESKHQKMYKNSPTLETDETGKKYIKKNTPQETEGEKDDMAPDSVMYNRHIGEVSDMHDRHLTERKDMVKRHMDEMKKSASSGTEETEVEGD